MRFLKTFFRFCTITILCTTFTTVAWGYAWENLSTTPNCNHNTVLDCVAVTGCAYYPVVNKCGESLCSDGTKAACNKKAGCIWITGTDEKNCQVVPGGYFSPDGDKTWNGNTYERSYHYDCPAGYYCKAGSGWPIICSAGTYSGANASICTNCPAGTYRGTTGGTSESSCTKCSAGTYSTGGASICEFCAIGTYQDSKGQSSCKTCPDGTTTANKGSDSINDCKKQFYLNIIAEYQKDGTIHQDTLTGGVGFLYNGSVIYSMSGINNSYLSGKISALNNKYTAPNSTGQAYITINGTNYDLQANSGNWSLDGSNVSILQSQPNGSTFNLVLKLQPKTYNVYMLSASTNSGMSMMGYDQPTKDIVVDTEAIASKNFGAALSAVTPNTEKVQTCATILGYGGMGGTTTYSYGYIADTDTPTYYECTIDGNEATIYLGNNYKKTTIFEPSIYGRHICVGYVHTTCEAGYSCNSCDRTACAAGKYQDTTGQSSCKNCIAGSATNGSTTSCTPCGVGTYSSGTANASCTACAAGKYQDTTGQSSCKDCSEQTSNKYPSSAKGSDNINDCYVTTTAGKYVAEQGKGEVPCACGGYCVGGTVVYYSSGVGSTTGGRSTCGAGKYNSNTSSTTSDACKITSAGYYATTGSCNQTKVNAGCYGAAGSTSACPNNCPSDTDGRTVTSAQGSDAATDCYVSCGAKTISDGTASVVSSTINYNGTSYPACTYNTDCNAGYYGADDVTDPSCTQCPAGTYQTDTGQSSCISCEDGTAEVTSTPTGIFTTQKGATLREQCYFKSSLTLKDDLGEKDLKEALGVEEENFPNVFWVDNNNP